ncbi:hypothetical protein ABC347_18055 [Sphingomonas sp. 1P06PA]
MVVQPPNRAIDDTPSAARPKVRMMAIFSFVFLVAVLPHYSLARIVDLQ